MQNTMQRRPGILLAGATLGLMLFSLPTLAQSGTGSGGSTGGTDTTPSTQRTTDTNHDSGFNPSWLGLLGLVGLAGLRRQPTHTVTGVRQAGQ